VEQHPKIFTCIGYVYEKGEEETVLLEDTLIIRRVLLVDQVLWQLTLMFTRLSEHEQPLPPPPKFCFNASVSLLTMYFKTLAPTALNVCAKIKLVTHQYTILASVSEVNSPPSLKQTVSEAILATVSEANCHSQNDIA